jgi:L-asparaginase
MLQTGGTIGVGMTLKRFRTTLEANVPELWRLARLDIVPMANKDSSQNTPRDWTRLASRILAHGDDYDAFVITHGTDTMVYTGTALSYLLPQPFKPVVLTGSQRPLGEIRTDARRNLINSVAMGLDPHWISEVSIFFDTLLIRANRAKKIHIEEYHTFDSPNFPRLAEERLKTVFTGLPREAPRRRPELKPEFDTRIQVVKAFPGASVALMPGARAVVLEGFGCGNLPVEGTVETLLKTCRRKRVPVVLTSQVPAGALSPEIYEMGRRALELGAISSLDMTFEATLVKCMMLAANRWPYAYWPEAVTASWAGEISA